MPRRDGLSPHKNLRRSTREHSSLYSSLQENQLGHNDDDDFDEIYHPPTRSRRSYKSTEYTKSGRKVHHNRYYDNYGGESSEEDCGTRRRSSRQLTYRQQMVMAIDESARAQKDRERKPDGKQVSRRNRVTIDEDEDEDDPMNGLAQSNIIESPIDQPEPTEERRSSRLVVRSTSSREPDGVPDDESPIRKLRTRASRRLKDSEEPEELKVDDEKVVKTEVEENGVENKEEEAEDGDSDEKDQEEDKEAEESSSSSSSSEEDQVKRQYSLRRTRKPVVTFTEEQARERERRALARSRERIRRPNEGQQRHHRPRNGGNRRIRGGDPDSSGDDAGRFERTGRHHLDRTRFMPINMSEKEISSAEHILQDRMRKTAGGQGSSDIDPMSLDTSVNFDQVGGLGHHIQSLKEVVLFPMLYPEVFSKFNINPPKGVVFYGPPGTGKTLVARALANECRKGANKVAFFMRKGADCLSKWVGESERQLRLLFDQAYAMRPSIIFFDEIDGLAPVRSSKQDQIHASIVSTLLALMDGLDCRGEVVIIGATNRLDTLDPALRRPGRFDRELRFSLPDLNARRQILDIHTSKWENNKPTEATLNAIAERTSGYCGADLKFLCTESVLIALRARYPHIYMTSERLKLDISTIKVETEHFGHAMRRITPASRRDLTIPSRPLDERTSILLGETVDNLISLRIPHGYRVVENAAQTTATELEKVVRALEPNPTVPAIRLLVCGSIALADGGQTSYVIPALLSKLDHLPVFSLSISSLLTDGRPEEAFSNAVQSAMRASSTGPCILLLPSIDEWIKVIPVSVQHMLITCLESMTGFTPILFLASLDSSFADAPEYVTEIFRHANCIAMNPSRRAVRKTYFDHVLQPIFSPPKIFDPSLYIAPEVASQSDTPSATRKLSEEEARELEKMYLSLLRQMRIFLRDRLNRLIRDRRFVDFVMPVDVEDAEDYYEIIESPMCLTDMMEKLDKKEYVHADQFLADVRLITSNALEYNPAGTQDGRTIRHMAIGLRDVAEEMFDCELDENFVENLENTSRLLQEAGIKPEDEQLIEIPNGFARKIRWSIKNSLAIEIVNWKKSIGIEAAKIDTVKKEDKQDGETCTSNASTEGTTSTTNGRTKRKRSKSYNFPGHKKRKTVKSPGTGIFSDEEDPVDKIEGPTEEEEMDEFAIDDEEEEHHESHPETAVSEVIGVAVAASASTSSSSSSSPPPSTQDHVPVKELIFSHQAIDDLKISCLDKSEGWSVSELERLASVMSHRIEQFRDEWNRSILPSELELIVQNWQPLHEDDHSDSLMNGAISPMKNGITNGH